jgi:hypothetical protein
MSRSIVLRPTGRSVVWQPDRQWPRVLAAVLLLGGVIAGLLMLVGWPRLQTIAVHYDLMRLRAEVEQLQRTERALTMELERERNPAVLAERAHALGLTPPDPEAFRTGPAEEAP